MVRALGSCGVLVLLAAGVGCALSRGAVEAPPQRVAAEQQHMGTRFRIVTWGDDEARIERAQRAAFARIAALDAMLSHYRADSELSRLTREAVGQPVVVSADLFAVLTTARVIAAASDGRFDVTVGPFVALWRRARRLAELPTAERMAAAAAVVSPQFLALGDGRRVELARHGMKLDLGGIAKGYAADRALAVLRARGLPCSLVDAGGDVAVGDPPPGESGWLVGLAGLGAGTDAGTDAEAIRVANCSVATSGSVFQHADIAGRRYAHIIDPRTGLGSTSRSVATVVAQDAAVADAWATVAFLCGDDVATLAALTAELRAVEPGRVDWLVRLPEPDRGRVECRASPGFPALEPRRR